MPEFDEIMVNAFGGADESNFQQGNCITCGTGLINPTSSQCKFCRENINKEENVDLTTYDENDYYDDSCEKHGTRFPVFGFCPPCEEEAIPVPPAPKGRCWECGKVTEWVFCDPCARWHDPLR